MTCSVWIASIITSRAGRCTLRTRQESLELDPNGRTPHRPDRRGPCRHEGRLLTVLSLLSWETESPASRPRPVRDLPG
jgi:hypothetical protein